MEGNIKVEKCPQCGAPVKIETNKCEYCEAEFLVTSLAYLDRFDTININKYINYYKELLKKDPDNGEISCAIGICYLDLGLYDLAIKYFSKTIEQLPEYADAYYYYALALFKGRRPKVLTLFEIREIESYLKAAIQIDNTKSKYFFLLAIIKYDFYIKNGLKVNPPTFEELIREIKSKCYDEGEIKKILKHVPISDKELIDILTQK